MQTHLNQFFVRFITKTMPGICSEDDQSGCTLADILADINKTDELTVNISSGVAENSL